MDSNIKCFDYKKIFFPVNINNYHWVLVIINLNAKSIGYLDSMGNSDSYGYMDDLLQWLYDEAIAKSLDPLNKAEWKLTNFSNIIPRQHESLDCGAFVIVAAHFIWKGKPLHYSQNDMNDYREKIGNSILVGTPF